MSTEKKDYLVPTLTNMKEGIINLMPPIVKDTSKFFNNTLTAIRRNPDLMKYTLQPASCMKLICEVERLARVGLMIGGTRPQAYIVPFGGSPTAIPTADGYKFIVTAGKHALFKSVNLYPIYKDDKFDLDEANGIFDKKETSGNNFNKDIRDFQGFVFKVIMADGEIILKKVTLSELEQHRKFSKDNRENSFWNTHPMRMYEKTGYKHVLRDYIFMCEGLSNLEEFEISDVKITNEEKVLNLSSDEVSEPKKKPTTQKKKTKVVNNKDESVSDLL